jgi:hypothetical protein
MKSNEGEKCTDSQKKEVENDIVSALLELFSDESIKEIELVCCDKEGPRLRTKDKVIGVKGALMDDNRYSWIKIDFEHFSWTFHHRIPIHSIIPVSENEYRINYTNPWICGQFLIRVYRK